MNGAGSGDRSRTAAVIGCGIAGLSTALYLAERGVSVTCIDACDGAAQETSFLNGALVCPSLTYPWANAATLRKLLVEMVFCGKEDKKYIFVDRNLMMSPPFLHFGINFALHSMRGEKFRANYTASHQLSMLTQECLRAGGFAYAADSAQRGSLQLFSAVSDRDDYFDTQTQVVPGVSRHGPEQACRFEAALSDPSRFQGGFIYSDLDRTMDSYKLCRAIKSRAEALGVRFILGRRVESFSVLHDIGQEKQGKVITSVTLDDGSSVSADLFVAANGNDSNTIAEWAGDGRHSWPIRGFVLDTPTSEEFAPLQHAIVDDVRKVYIAPLGHRRVRISGLCEVKALSAAVRVPEEELRERCALLFGQAKALMPDRFFIEPTEIIFQGAKPFVAEPTVDVGGTTTADIAVTQSTAVFHTCQRPQTADDLPVIGRSGGVKNLYYNSGHGHLGLTRSLGSAKILTGLMLGDPSMVALFPALDVSQFSPTRFQLLKY